MADLPPLSLFDEIRRVHGHYCPMSTLGGRMGFAARRRLAPGRLQARYLLRTCAVEGVAVATGCREEDGTLEVREGGRHALIATEIASGCRLEVALRRETLDLAWDYRRLDEALEREREGLPAAELERRSREKDRFLADLLQRLRTLPEADLFVIREFRDEDLITEHHA